MSRVRDALGARKVCGEFDVKLTIPQGFGRTFAGGWCACRRAFSRPVAEYVRYA